MEPNSMIIPTINWEGIDFCELVELKRKVTFEVCLNFLDRYILNWFTRTNIQPTMLAHDNSWPHIDHISGSICPRIKSVHVIKLFTSPTHRLDITTISEHWRCGRVAKFSRTLEINTDYFWLLRVWGKTLNRLRIYQKNERN